MLQNTSLEKCGCQVVPPPHRVSGAPTATRLLPGRVKGVPGWEHGFGANPSESHPAGAALDVVLVLLNPGIPGIPPLASHGSTGLPCASSPVPAAIAAVVVHVGAVTIR